MAPVKSGGATLSALQLKKGVKSSGESLRFCVLQWGNCLMIRQSRRVKLSSEDTGYSGRVQGCDA